jgi:hypothetical protein
MKRRLRIKEIWRSFELYDWHVEYFLHCWLINVPHHFMLYWICPRILWLGPSSVYDNLAVADKSFYFFMSTTFVYYIYSFLLPSAINKLFSFIFGLLYLMKLYCFPCRLFDVFCLSILLRMLRGTRNLRTSCWISSFCSMESSVSDIIKLFKLFIGCVSRLRIYHFLMCIFHPL